MHAGWWRAFELETVPSLKFMRAESGAKRKGTRKPLAVRWGSRPEGLLVVCQKRLSTGGSTHQRRSRLRRYSAEEEDILRADGSRSGLAMGFTTGYGGSSV
ncbi:hypothetical protein EV426DRAFT_708831 [Tirmania nivea]|nr:hypothetical protein EV426DRAFT_708831 [Tirmania nivea]